MTRHVILAYGREIEHRRAIFAILSFWAWYGGPKHELRTVVFTDKPALFEAPLAGLPVDYEVLGPERLLELRGPQQNVHRVKVAIIGQVFGQHPGARVLFTDSDTFFVAEAQEMLARVRPGTSLMHEREYRLADAVGIHAAFNQAKYPRRLLDFIKDRTFALGATRHRFHDGQFSWNSGVLGLPPDLGALMPDIMALTDALYEGTGWFTSEQLAFSLALQCKTQVESSSEYVLHYWGERQKKLMDSNLLTLFDNAFNAHAVPDRLVQVRRLATRWCRAVELDRDREGALYAFAQGNTLAGVKCALKAFVAAPLNTAFPRALVRVLRQRTRKRIRPSLPV